MNQQQADAEAKRIWGPKALAKECSFPGYVEIVIDIAEAVGWNVKKWGPLTRVLGYGKTWDEAMQNAKAGQFERGRA
jgi:hypothetical protein